ncbi:MAG: N-acetylmuramoyl-L-alanine amidase [Flavobacteriaceae bacterium]|jgi:N-acetylmuramoyl-L-alanine amidase|nr:N-acetylmuramoyl-L-alanine amidase [Flavobacteriaceae bacterium]
MQIKLVLVFILFLGTITSSAQTNPEPFVVVLDAGHGGKDPGKSTKSGYKEKDIALKIVLKIGENLKKHKNIKVIYTRKTDVFIELRKRASIANKADADLFVSVHCNAHDSQAHGTETFVLGLHRNESNFRVAQQENEVIFFEDNYETNYEGFDPNSPESMIGLTLMQEDYLDQSILLARNIQDNFTNILKRKNRGVKQAGFWVLHNTYMPSILIETGFITNKKEGYYLNSVAGKNNISKSISDAILDYKSKLNTEISVENTVSTKTAPSFNEPDSLDQSFNTKKPIDNSIIFKVQISAGSKKLSTKSYNFKGLKEISRTKSNTLYRYFYGNTSSYDEIVKFKNKAITKGYTTAYIVAYKNGQKIAIKTALKSTEQ